MEDDTKISQGENSPLDDPQPTDFSEIIKEHAFLGRVPVSFIIESIRKQFEDYVNIEDDINYVDIFYNQLAISYLKASHESEEHPNELREILDNIYQSFIDTMQSLFATRLTITIPELESGNMDDEDLEFVIRRLYEFFILGARTNFKIVISADIRSKLDDISDDNYFNNVLELMDNYTPLITSMTPIDFLQYRGDQEIRDIFENGLAVGNFLRKYSPKLYQNEELISEIVNHITMIRNLLKNMKITPSDDLIPNGDVSE